MENTIVITLGSTLVLMNAFERFNTPPSNRATTTAARYYTAAAVYLMIYLLAYFLLLYYQDLLNLLLKLLNQSQFDRSLPASVVGAILLSSILPKVPGFSSGDQKLRRFFQNLAAIPIQALRLSREIYEAPFSVPVEFRQRVRDHLAGLGFDEADIVFEQQDSAKSLWLKNAILLIQLKDWGEQANFSEFCKERNEHLKRLTERYQKLTGMAQNCFNMVREVGGHDTRHPMEVPVKKFYANFKEQADDLFRELCQLTSQGILKCRLTRGSRYRSLKNMGFTLSEGARSATLSIHQFLLLFGLLMVLISVNFIILFPTWDRGEKALLMSFMIVSVYSAAVLCTVLLKDKLPGFQRSPGQFPPCGAYLAVGLVAVAAGILISLFFKTLIFFQAELGGTEALIRAWQEFKLGSYPWMFQAFSTAIIISVLVDYPPPRGIPEKSWRFAEAAIQGGLTMASAFFVRWWLGVIQPGDAVLPNAATVYVVSAVVGTVLGFIVPCWYRQAKLRERTVADKAAAPPLAVASHG
ncbi:MAG: hypothetical protein EHM37_06205 [Deltaproteobacteria bacterium]|nr:MAG: hypothetical protein EHM37_06205 [Deltaproteobacteria bacterium]